MYKVSENYLEALSEKVYEDRISGTITLKNGDSIRVSDDILVKNSLKITRELCGKEYRIGSFNLSCLKMAIFDQGALGRDYSNAVIKLNYHLKLKNGGEEAVPLGIFIADGVETSRKRDKVYITAYDGGIYFDREPSDDIRNMTATPIELITAICEECGAELGVIDEKLPNGEVLVNISDKQIQTCRDAVMWCSALMCGYAVIDREGKLNIIPAKYGVSEGSTIVKRRSIGVNERNSIYSTDTRAYIRYLTAYCGEKVRQYDSEYEAKDSQAAPASYAMTKNPLLSGKSEEEWDEINRAWHKYIERFMQRGITARIFGDPALDVGDTVSFYGGDIDQRGNVIGIVTSYEWKYRNYHDIYCAAAECGERADSECITPSTKVRNQTEKRIDALSGSSGNSSSVLSAVSFEKNRLYYNGETYHLQFGLDKRIMCVTKGDKYALISSPDYTGSRIEAATAVMKGLTEDWDLQFDYFGNITSYGQTLSVSDIIDYSGAVKCDWGDGTVDNELSHTYYNTGNVVVKIKLLGETGDISNIGMSAFGNWESFDNKLFHEQGIGIRLYIGGSIKGVQFGDWYDSLNCVSFGESVKIVKGQRSTPDSRLNKPYEIGIPPFVKTIGHYAYIYSSSDYIYIPESCTKIEPYAFYMNGAREIEIEEKGGAIEIGAGCFSHASNGYCFGKTVSAKIPSRVTFDYSQGNTGIFYRNATDSLYIGSGITDIPYILCNYAEVGNDKFSDIELNRPYFIFIPNTVKTIGAGLVCTARPTYIICEGSWSNITKDSSWNYNSGSDNIKIINDGYLYKNAHRIIEHYLKGK